VRLLGNVTPTVKKSDHRLDKIFRSIPAGTSDFTHASVRHYILRSIFIDKLLLFLYIQPIPKQVLITIFTLHPVDREGYFDQIS
jgi:hypothetical protein